MQAVALGSELAARVTEIERRRRASMLAGSATAGHNATAAAAGICVRGEPRVVALWERLGRGIGPQGWCWSGDALPLQCLKTPPVDDAGLLFDWHASPNQIGVAMAGAATASWRGCGAACLAVDSQQLLAGGTVHSVVRGESGPGARELMRQMWSTAGGGQDLRLPTAAPGQTAQSAAARTDAHLQHAELLAIATALLLLVQKHDGESVALSVEQVHAALVALANRRGPALKVAVFVSRRCCGCCVQVLTAIAKTYNLSIRVTMRGARSWRVAAWAAAVAHGRRLPPPLPPPTLAHTFVRAAGIGA